MKGIVLGTVTAAVLTAAAPALAENAKQADVPLDDVTSFGQGVTAAQVEGMYNAVTREGKTCLSVSAVWAKPTNPIHVLQCDNHSRAYELIKRGDKWVVLDD
mgnify:CR=1 FL=1